MFMASAKICVGFILLLFPFEYGLNKASVFLGMIAVILVLAGLASAINVIIDQKS